MSVERQPESGEARMPLMEHLRELRVRLWRCVIAVSILGGLSLWYARPLFGWLMQPVLNALPEESRALVYTSGIEEINVLLKVGMYAGVFLAAPVILYQLWQFVAPGLYAHERRYVLPFVTLGTTFFVGGALFCYFAVLPTMFKFLLTEADEHEVHQRSLLARSEDADAARLLALGEKDKSAALIATAREFLLKKGDGQVDEPSDSLLNPPSLEEVKTRDQLFGAQLDTAMPLVSHGGDAAKSALLAAIEAHQQAQLSLNVREPVPAAQKLEEAAKQLGATYAAALGKGYGDAFADLWRLDKHLGMAVRREASIEWTRPMLTMNEQLSLVLLLEVAFGVIFELPLIMTLLSWLGLVNAALLAKYQRHAILMCVVLAAVITPSGDAVNLSLMAVPMIVCYELGVLGAWIVGRRKQKQTPPDLKVVG